MKKERTGCICGGFTLLELSIVLVVIALVTAMAIGSGINIVATTKLSATKSKMAAIEQALLAYRIANNRLPCPGDLTAVIGSSNYGLEAGAGSGSAIGVGTGVCTGGGMLPQANYTAAGATYTTATGAEGALPAVSLGLPADFMLDGWGNKIRYTVDISYTALGAFAAQGVSCINGAITVKDRNNSNRTAGAVYALVSHGANGHGSYTKNGVTLNAGITNANELINCHCTSAGVYNSAYAPTYIQMQSTLSAGSPLNSFDDLVAYKERWQLQAAWDPPGTCAAMYIGDQNNQRIRKVSSGIMTTVVGTGTAGYTGDGGAATSAQINFPFGATADSAGNIYIGDILNNRLRKVSTSGIITTVAGNGTAGYSGDGGAATSAKLNQPKGIAIDSSGNVYIVDYNNSRVRKVNTSGIISTAAGNGTAGYAGDNGAATSAELNLAVDAVVDSAGNLYISDYSNNRIRKVNTAGIITTVAGNGTASYAGDGGAATSAALNGPFGIALDSIGNIYIADAVNNRIRKVNTSGIISTVAGNGTATYAGDGGAATSAGINTPRGVAVDNAGNLYISDSSNNRIRMVNTSGIISTVAGNGTATYAGDGGAATSAGINGPRLVSLSR